ncbi:MAG: hypothetical protein LBQ91_03220 [Oscillospiraceae bacterium]|nr:hypothetical protein [Oscillospiraceae bacterium]
MTHQKKAALIILLAILVIASAWFISLNKQRLALLALQSTAQSQLDNLRAEVDAKRWYLANPNAPETKEWLAYQNGYINPGDIVVRVGADGGNG